MTLTAAAEAVAAGLRDADSDSAAVLAALTENRIPALSVALVRDGQIAAARAWGTRDVAGTEPATTQTRLLAGSVSKPVTAVAALRLVADGVLDLDEDVNERLTRWQVPPLGDWQPTITVRHLLSHTAGLTVHGFPGYPRDRKAPDTVGVLNGEGNTPAVVPDTLPGLRWRYSGGGTTVVQLLLEEVTGRSFAELLDDLVLRPAGMTTATFVQPPPEDLHPLLAEGTTVDGTPVPGGWHVYPEQAAAGLWCTPTDLARWVAAVQEARAGTGDLLPQALAEEMLREQAPGWGLGPNVARAGEHPRFGHGGSDEGFLTTLEAGRQDGTGIVAMASSNASGELLRAVVDAVAAAEGWAPFPPRPPRDPAALLARYTGSWRTPDGLDVRIDATGTGLALHLPGQRPLALSPHSVSLWSSPVGVEVEFAPTSPDQPVSELTVRPASSFTAHRVDAEEPRPVTTPPPYRKVVRAGDFLYVSGQLPMRDGVLVDGGIVEQTEQVLANLDELLRGEGADRTQVVKTLVLLADFGDWAAMNVPYRAFFDEDALPARSAFGVQLGEGVLVEIEAVAYVGG